MYVRRRIRVNPAGAAPTETAVTPKTRFMPKRPAQAGFGDTTPWCRSPAQPPLWVSPIPGTGPPKQGVLAGRLTPCQPRECSSCVDARSTSCASPALPVVSPLGTRRSSAPDHPVDARPLGSHLAASAIRAATNGHRPERCDRVTDRRDLNETTIPGGVRHRSDLGPAASRLKFRPLTLTSSPP
jgi:hypothetical protein